MRRREFIGGLSGAGALALLSPRALAAPDISLGVLEQARKLAAGKRRVLRLLLPDGCQGNLEAAIESFTRATGVAIQQEITPVDDINAKLLLAAARGRGSPDVALPASFGIPELAEAGAIQPIDAFARRYQPADLDAGALYTLGDYYRGKRYGYQTDGDTYLLFLLRDWLEDPGAQAAFASRFGQPLKAPETWAELDRQIRFFHRPDEQRFGGALFRSPNYLVWEWWMRLHAAGGRPVNEDFEPTLGGELGVRALEALIAITPFLHPEARALGLFGNWKLYGQGRCYANLGWGGTQKFLRGPKSSIRDRVLPLAPPRRDDGTGPPVAYFNWGWNYTVGGNAEHPELAYLFALYAVCPKTSTTAVRNAGGYFDPFRREHYADAGIRESYGAAFLKAHRESLAASIPDFYVLGQSEYFGALRQHIARADAGELKPAEALDRVAKSWRRITRRIGPKTQRAQWAFLRKAYPVAHAQGG